MSERNVIIIRRPDEGLSRRCLARMIQETRIEFLGRQEVYAPCPCGSGKKYKFCCRPQR